jgi:hypothetical protein
MSSQRTLADYRPQHDGDCSIYCCVQCSERQNDFHHWSPPVDAPNKWVRHSFQPRSCSCGLSALLSPPLSDSERVTCYTPMLWAVLTEDQKYEEYLRVRSLLSPPPVTPEEERLNEEWRAATEDEQEPLVDRLGVMMYEVFENFAPAPQRADESMERFASRLRVLAISNIKAALRQVLVVTKPEPMSPAQKDSSSNSAIGPSEGAETAEDTVKEQE